MSRDDKSLVLACNLPDGAMFTTGLQLWQKGRPLPNGRFEAELRYDGGGRRRQAVGDVLGFFSVGIVAPVGSMEAPFVSDRP